MTEREKLIELLQEREEGCFFCEHHKKGNCPDECMEKIECERLADYLLSHGVTIPVRCEDCANAEDAKDCERLYCDRLDMFVKYNWYCACGERRPNG